MTTRQRVLGKGLGVLTTDGPACRGSLSAMAAVARVGSRSGGGVTGMSGVAGMPLSYMAAMAAARELAERGVEPNGVVAW